MSDRFAAVPFRNPATWMCRAGGAAARWLGRSLALGLIATGPALAQEAPQEAPTATPRATEFQALIDGIQARIDKLDKTAGESEQALDYLEKQVDEAINLLASRLNDNAALRQKAAELSAELEASTTLRERLESELQGVTPDQARTVERLRARVQEQAELIARERDSAAELRASVDTLLAELQATIDERDRIQRQFDQASLADPADRAQLERQREEIEALRQRHAAIDESNAALESRVAELTTTIGTTKQELAAALTRNATLEERLEAALARATALESQAAAEAEQAPAAPDDADVQALRERAEAAERALADERALARELQRKVRQLSRLRVALSEMVEAAEAKARTEEAAAADLDRQLQQALATRVQELAKYRSEFFGRLRQVLGERPDIQIVGDRFVFQAEVLFATGEATLEPAGQQQLVRFAATLKEIAATIPPEIDWVLRVDGHTDRRPIQTARFPSNWELSTARAISVVKFLIDQGIAPERLVGAGFGQFHPLDPREDEIAFRRNRRIEFKLTQR